MEEYQQNAAAPHHHHSSSTPVHTECIPVPLKCGLCEYSTSDINALVEHTSTHALQRHPFKCTQCTETFPGYTELQQHPCGDAQFVFLLSTPQTDKNLDITHIPQGEVVDLSTASRKRNQNMNIVSGPATPKRHKSDDDKDKASVTEEKNVTKDKASVTEEKNVILTLGQPRTLRARMTPQKYTDPIMDDPPEEDLQTKQQSGKPQHVNTPARPPGKENENRGKNTLSCKYCNFKSPYPSNLRNHTELHQQPGRQHYECQVCQLKFLTPKKQKSHHCGQKKLKTPKLKPATTKLKTPRQKQPEISKMETLKPKPDNVKSLKVKPEMKLPTQVLDTSKKKGSITNASSASPGKATPAYVHVCRLCDFMAISKCNVMQHVYRHRCMSCHDYFTTVSKRSTHMSRCKKPIVTYSKEQQQQITNIRGETLTYCQAAPRTLVSLGCVTCKGRFQHPEEYQLHRCTTKKQHTKGPSSQGSTGGKTPKVKSEAKGSKTPQSKFDAQKKASQTKGKTPIKSSSTGVGAAGGGSSSSSKKPAGGKMEGYDDKLQMYSCKFCVFTNPTPLAIINHLKSHKGTETPLEKTPALQAQRLEFARQREQERTRPRMEGWDDEAMQYVCDVCSFATSTPIVLLNHKKRHHKGLPQDSQMKCEELSEVGEEDEDLQHEEPELEEEEAVSVSVDDEDEELEAVVEQDDVVIIKETKRRLSKSNKWLTCESCDFTTRRSWNLQAHSGLHTGTRPFKCHDCNIGFTEHYYLKIHLMNLHGKEDGESDSNRSQTGQTSRTESCPQVGCSFMSDSTTALTQHFRHHLQTMSTDTSHDNPHQSGSPDKTHKLPQHPDLSDTADEENQVPPQSAGKTKDGSDIYQSLTPTTVTAKGLPLTVPSDDRLSVTKSPELVAVLSVNTESPDLVNAVLPDKTSSETTPHKKAVTSSLAEGPKESVIAVAEFKVLQPVKPYLSRPRGNPVDNTATVVDDTATSALDVTSDSNVGADPRPELERGHVCSSEHPEVSHLKYTPRSVSTSTAQSTTEKVVRGDEMPVLQRQEAGGSDLVNTDTGNSAQGIDTQDEDSRADVPRFSPISPYLTPGGSGGHTQEEFRGVWRRPLQTKSCMQLFPESTANTTSATGSASVNTDLSTNIASPNTTEPCMFNTPNTNRSTAGISANTCTAAQPISPDRHITNPIPVYGSGITVTTDSHRRSDNSTQSLTDSSHITTRPIVDTSPDARIATRPIINSSATDHHRLIDTSPDGRIATRPVIPLDMSYHHPSWQTSAATAGGLGVGSRSLGSLHRCGFCAVYFEDLRLFLHHMGRHHPDHPWTCTGCWKNFRNAVGFIDHH